MNWICLIWIHFREVAMQPVLNQQKLKALVYYIEVPFLFNFSKVFKFSSWKVLLNYLPEIREPVRKFLVSLRDWPVSKQWFALMLYWSLSFIGANGLQLTAAHFVQKESWRVARTPPTVLENSGRVGRLQREQSAVQRVPMRSLVISQRCKVFLDNAVLIFRTLFHTLTVSAATKDPAFSYGGVSSVANSMIGLIHNSLP